MIFLNSIFCNPSSKEPSKDSFGSAALKIALNQISFLGTLLGTCIDSAFSVGYSAGFTSYLKNESVKQVFEKTIYQNLPFDQALNLYRKNVETDLKKGAISEENKKVGTKIMTQRGLWSANLILNRYLPAQDSNVSLAEQFDLDMKSIKSRAHQAGQGFFNREIGKLNGEMGLFFDPHMNGNLPFLLGTRKINGSNVHILRHPVPTIENGTIKISPEYLAFLENCKSKNEKVLYCCLLNNKKSREVKLIKALRSLEVKYPGVFHLVNMPLDGALSKVGDEKESLQSYRRKVEDTIQKSFINPEKLSDFSFGSSKLSEVAHKRYKEVASFAYDQIQAVYQGRGVNAPLKEQKQAFMMLFCTLLRTVLIKECNINHYSNTCKDAIDRAAANLTSDLLWESFLANNVKQSSLNLRISAAWPAFMAKTQPVIKERAEWMISFAKWVEGASHLGLRDRILKEYSNRLGICFNDKMSFNNLI